MLHLLIEEAAVLPAPPQDVHALLADYQVAHPAVLPKPFFVSCTVERGGRGAGTACRLEMRVMGRNQVVHFEVSEPEPGRVISEQYKETGGITTFTMIPEESGRACRLIIRTESASRGLFRLMERLLAPRMLRPVYREELQNIAAAVSSRSSTS